QHQLGREPDRRRRPITPRQLAITLATGAVAAWVWQRTGGDGLLTAWSTTLTAATLQHHVSA
ncbi:MAG: hypothetical protein HOV66_09000, partial [Streptomycetaceae bacterium]|nr:hypothetical protein [Streptomycetaceae bacterium]